METYMYEFGTITAPCFISIFGELNTIERKEKSPKL